MGDGVAGQHLALALYPQERLGTHCIGGWLSPRAFLDSAENLALRRVWTLNHVHSCYTHFAILAHLLFMKEYVGCGLAAFRLGQR